jgi:hypothetical protein
MSKINWTDKRWDDHVARVNQALDLCKAVGGKDFMRGVESWLRYPLSRDASLEAQERGLEQAAQDTLWQLAHRTARTDLHPEGAPNIRASADLATAALYFQTAKAWLTGMWEEDSGRA